MRKKTNFYLSVFIVLLTFLSILGCKNDGEGSGGLFGGGDDLESVTASELESGLASVPSEGLRDPELLREFYGSREYAPIWNDSDLRNDFLDELEKAGDEGLFLKDYHAERIEDLLKEQENETPENRVQREVLLTDAFFSYADDLFYGKLNPEELYSLWGIERQEISVTDLLEKALETEDVSEVLNSLKPQNEIYTGLKQSLKEYREKLGQDSTAVKIPSGESLKPDKKDARTLALAARLQQLGYLEDSYTQKDSLYNESLQTAVRQFQKDNGMEPDGIAGASTFERLNQGYTDLYNKVLVNLERWRWYPRDLGDHYILVNIPDFKLAVIKDGDTLRRHNVIAGSKQRQTPIFTDTLEYIVINPQWHIPPTIEREDIIPKASSNPSYLANNNIFVTGPDGGVVDPSSINWSAGDVGNYQFTQRAGPSNPLGQVKIIYPNQYIIYLHDTPAQALFNREDRAESSGCVRVENAVDLASYVVENQEDWSLEKLQESIASGETQQVEIDRPIQVHHLYWTAWRGRDKTYFAEDVYDLDQKVLTQLKAD